MMAPEDKDCSQVKRFKNMINTFLKEFEDSPTSQTLNSLEMAIDNFSLQDEPKQQDTNGSDSKSSVNNVNTSPKQPFQFQFHEPMQIPLNYSKQEESQQPTPSTNPPPTPTSATPSSSSPNNTNNSNTATVEQISYEEMELEYEAEEMQYLMTNHFTIEDRKKSFMPYIY